MTIWNIQRLVASHQRSAFDCGQPLLNDWLKHQAGQFDRRDLARTYVAVIPGEAIVRGYYAISSHRVVHESLDAPDAKGLPRLDVPVVLLGRLAVDRSAQRQGLGGLLLVDALSRTVHLADQLGIRAVEVDAIDENARRFYLHYGFRSLKDDPRHLFLPLHEIRKLNLDSKG